MNKIIEEFFQRLDAAKSRLLMLDYDGTLSPFRTERDKAYPYAGVEQRLNILIAAKNTRVVIISGRALDDLKPLLRLDVYPELWGSHGFERLDVNGGYLPGKLTEEQKKGLKIAQNHIIDNDLEEYMEVKPVSVAIHYRGMNSEKALEIEHKIVHNWNRLKHDFSLTWSRFNGGLELKTKGVNKGDAIREIFQDCSENTVAAYLGDDLTDEDAFRALPETALGILVSAEDRPTAASARITPPAELLNFLDGWIKIETIQKHSTG